MGACAALQENTKFGLFVFIVSPQTIELCFEQLKYHLTINTSKILRAGIWDVGQKKKQII